MRVENNNVSGQNHDPEQIDLIDLLVQLWRGKMTIIISVIVAIALAIGYLVVAKEKWTGFAPIFPDTCYHLTHYWLAAVDIPVASDNPVHYADAIRYNARTPLQGSLLPLTRLVWA